MKKNQNTIEKIFSMTTSNHPKIVLIGNYSDYNIGDLAILDIIFKEFAKHVADAKITVVSRFQSITRQFNPTIETMKPLSLRFLKQIITCDVLLVGGGGFFGHEMGTFAQFVPIIAMFCKILNKQIVFYNVGIYSHINPFTKFITNRALSVADIIELRSDSDISVVEEKILKRAALKPDPTFLLEPKPLRKVPKKLEKVLKQKIVAISLRKTDNSTDKKICESIKKLTDWLQSQNIHVVFVPFHPSDIEMAEKLFRNNKQKTIILNTFKLNPNEIKWFFGQFDLVIGMRYHAIVFALSMKTPLIGLAYANKCKNLLKSKEIKVFEANNLEPDVFLDFAKNEIRRLVELQKH